MSTANQNLPGKPTAPAAFAPAAGSARTSKRYRIVSDAYAGFEVQEWAWWWPFWTQIGINTHSTIEDARMWAQKIEIRAAEKKRKRALAGRVVEEVTPNARTETRRTPDA